MSLQIGVVTELSKNILSLDFNFINELFLFSTNMLKIVLKN
jgi:hypothetical protein